jgi:hypothetical protein
MICLIITIPSTAFLVFERSTLALPKERIKSASEGTLGGGTINPALDRQGKV